MFDIMDPKDYIKAEVFDFYRPKDNYIGILSIPHSGEIIPVEFQKYLVNDTRALAQDVDMAVDKLVDIEKLQNAGVGVMVAKIHRACVDLNRAAEISVLNWKNNSKGVPLVISDPTPEERERLIYKYHAPYYTMMKAMVESLQTFTPKVSFIDLHSMPSIAEEYHLKLNPTQEKERPDFCVSDNHGKTCEKIFIDHVCNELAKSYPKVTQNDPYIGGNITKHIHALFNEINNIQIEIKRANYMDEEKRSLIDTKVHKIRPILTNALIETFVAFAPRR